MYLTQIMTTNCLRASWRSGTRRGRTSRYAQGTAEKFQEFAAEMVHLKVDLIITNTTPAALAAKNVTTTIPIVIPTAIDPVGTGLIASLARPGGNITGGAILTGELAAKRLELLKEVISSLSRTAVLWNSANPANALAWRETQGAARALGSLFTSVCRVCLRQRIALKPGG
jgi:putative ABC transport system substrate-binding protein